MNWQSPAVTGGWPGCWPDSYGRPVTSFDANGSKTTTSYAMSSGLVTGTTVTNPLNQATATTLDPERGLTLTTTDPNGVVTTEQYDALGRVTGVWLDSRATSDSANYTFAYQVSNSGLTAVTTKKLNDEAGYQTSVQIYDAMLRPRQTQVNTPQGGRMVTDTFYDTRGWTEATFSNWWDKDNTPAAALATQTNLAGQAQDEDYYTYDGLGRQVIDDSEQGGTVVSATTTVYNGDRTTVVPPQGGTVKTTVTDPLGRKTALNEYSARPTVNVPADPNTGLFTISGGTYDTTSYGYDGHGNQATVTAAGRTWTSVYNLLGQVTAKTDPDAGASSMTYDGNGNLLQSTDSRNKTVSYTYDALDRKTGEYDAPVSSQSPSDQLASWVYDNSNNAVPGMTDPIGHLTTETAYWGGAAYTMQEKGFNVFGEPLQETITIPSATEGTALGKAYVFQHAYTSLTGLPLKDGYPAAGGLPAETVLYGYQGILDLPDHLGGLVGYSESTTYDAWRRVAQEQIGNSSGLADITNAWDPHTGRLTSQVVSRETATPSTVDTEAYTYDLSGNITAVASTRLGAPATSETQCYSYDQLDRLSPAWTATDNCAAPPPRRTTRWSATTWAARAPTGSLGASTRSATAPPRSSTPPVQAAQTSPPVTPTAPASPTRSPRQPPAAGHPARRATGTTPQGT